MRAHLLTLTLVVGCVATYATAQTDSSAVPAAKTAYSSSSTEIGTLLSDPLARAIIEKYLPALASSQNLDSVRTMTLHDLQQMAPDRVTNETLAKIDTELAALGTKK